MIKFRCASQWRAVDTAEITVVGNGNPEVVNRPLVAIGEQGHGNFWERIMCNLKKSTGL
jgi:hypothetical protein